MGVPVVHALAGVGENLQDHLEFYFQMACLEPITLYSALNPLSRFLIGLRWLLRHDGLGASNHFEAVHSSAVVPACAIPIFSITFCLWR